MMTYKVSVIIPCYNMGELLLETMESVDKVIDHAKHEMIIINDGSTEPKTLQILENLSKNRHIINQVNEGLSATRNKGIAVAKGQYCIFLDADNLLTDLYLTKGVDILDTNKDIDMVYGDTKYFGDDHSFVPARPFNLQVLLTYNFIDACCLVRKSIFDEVGGFDTQMKMGYEDWEMWLRMALKQKKFYYIKNEICQYYRIRKQSMVRDVDKKKRYDIFTYIKNKYPDQIDFDVIDDFYYSKFNQSPLGWTAKLFIKKYLPFLYNYLVKKGKLARRL